MTERGLAHAAVAILLLALGVVALELEVSAPEVARWVARVPGDPAFALGLARLAGVLLLLVVSVAVHAASARSASARSAALALVVVTFARASVRLAPLLDPSIVAAAGVAVALALAARTDKPIGVAFAASAALGALVPARAPGRALLPLAALLASIGPTGAVAAGWGALVAAREKKVAGIASIIIIAAAIAGPAALESCRDARLALVALPAAGVLIALGAERALAKLETPGRRAALALAIALPSIGVGAIELTTLASPDDLRPLGRELGTAVVSSLSGRVLWVGPDLPRRIEDRSTEDRATGKQGLAIARGDVSFYDAPLGPDELSLLIRRPVERRSGARLDAMLAARDGDVLVVPPELDAAAWPPRRPRAPIEVIALERDELARGPSGFAPVDGRRAAALVVEPRENGVVIRTSIVIPPSTAVLLDANGVVGHEWPVDALAPAAPLALPGRGVERVVLLRASVARVEP